MRCGPSARDGLNFDDRLLQVLHSSAVFAPAQLRWRCLKLPQLPIGSLVRTRKHYRRRKGFKQRKE